MKLKHEGEWRKCSKPEFLNVHGARNRFLGIDSNRLRQATQPGGNDSLESILGLLKGTQA